MGKYDAVFQDFTDLELVALQHKAREFPEDKEFVDEIITELGRRTKKRNEAEEAYNISLSEMQK